MSTNLDNIAYDLNLYLCTEHSLKDIIWIFDKLKLTQYNNYGRE